MRLITSVILALAAISSTVVAQNNPNAIIKPDGSAPLQAGTTVPITWQPGSPGPITLRLRKGPSTSLSKGDVIAGGIPNSGSFDWAIPKDTPAGSDYAITITDDAGVVPENFTPLLTIISDAAPKSSTSSSTDTATSGTATTTSGSTTRSTTGTYTKPHNSTMTTVTGRPNNSTAITGSSNATITTSSASETASSDSTTTDSAPALTPTSTGSSPSSSSTTGSTSGAISLLNSPLALVVCVLGAVFYLN